MENIIPICKRYDIIHKIVINNKNYFNTITNIYTYKKRNRKWDDNILFLDLIKNFNLFCKWRLPKNRYAKL